MGMKNNGSLCPGEQGASAGLSAHDGVNVGRGPGGGRMAIPGQADLACYCQVRLQHGSSLWQINGRWPQSNTITADPDTAPLM